jgi:hypothetical protein
MLYGSLASQHNVQQKSLLPGKPMVAAAQQHQAAAAAAGTPLAGETVHR